MKRMHLFEITELPACPTFLRSYATSYLEACQRLPLYPPYVDVAPLLAQLVRDTGCDRIVDLASGGGGPMPQLQRALLHEHGYRVHVTLTDLYPNHGAFAHLERTPGCRLETVRTPVDATAVPGHLTGIRTMFTAFHHFQPAAALAVLRDAVRSRAPIAIFEAGERSLPKLIATLCVPLVSWIAAPAVRPLRARDLFFVYMVPVIPLVLTWDALISGARCYSLDELRALSHELDQSGYEWRVGSEKVRRGAVTYLIGWPRT